MEFKRGKQFQSKIKNSSQELRQGLESKLKEKLDNKRLEEETKNALRSISYHFNYALLDYRDVYVESLKRDLDLVFHKLNSTEKAVTQMHFGLGFGIYVGRPATSKEITSKLGMSKMSVNYNLNQSVKKLAPYLEYLTPLAQNVPLNSEQRLVLEQSQERSRSPYRFKQTNEQTN